MRAKDDKIAALKTALRCKDAEIATKDEQVSHLALELSQKDRELAELRLRVAIAADSTATAASGEKVRLLNFLFVIVLFCPAQCL